VRVLSCHDRLVTLVFTCYVMKSDLRGHYGFNNYDFSGPTGLKEHNCPTPASVSILRE
jgi:hypothetical protein